MTTPAGTTTTLGAEEREERKEIISVVRDEALYRRLVAENPMLVGCKKHMLDNREENLGIPTRYNQFLGAYDYERPAWLIFCHEDFEFRQDLSFLDTLPHDSLYGPIGTRLERKGGKLRVVYCGQVLCSNRDGSQCTKIGSRVRHLHPVLTFDCQCIIVHSELVKRYGMRFDEKLTYDLYAEDFCAVAAERHGIRSFVTPIDCQHYSYGNLQPRFLEALAYLQKKWRGAQHYYVSTEGLMTFGGREALRVELKPDSFGRRLQRFLFQAKRTRSGRLIVKLFRIPVWWGRVERIWI